SVMKPVTTIVFPGHEIRSTGKGVSIGAVVSTLRRDPRDANCTVFLVVGFDWETKKVGFYSRGLAWRVGVIVRNLKIIAGIAACWRSALKDIRICRHPLIGGAERYSVTTIAPVPVSSRYSLHDTAVNLAIVNLKVYRRSSNAAVYFEHRAARRREITCALRKRRYSNQ